MSAQMEGPKYLDHLCFQSNVTLQSSFVFWCFVVCLFQFDKLNLFCFFDLICFRGLLYSYFDGSANWQIFVLVCVCVCVCVLGRRGKWVY